MSTVFQSLFYWIIYSYYKEGFNEVKIEECFNPYFTGLSILIIDPNMNYIIHSNVSILILLDYLFL